MRNAFTLIELLVVTGIIAILAAVMYPVVYSTKSSSKQNVCMNNVKQLALAFNMYHGDADDRFPIGGWDQGGGLWSRWYLDLAPYTKNKVVRYCPSTPVKYDPSAGWGASYGVNPSISGWQRSISESSLAHGSRTVLLSDALQLSIQATNAKPSDWARFPEFGTDWQVTGPYEFGSGSDKYPYTEALDQTGSQLKRPYPAHEGFCTVGFADGNAKALVITRLIGPMPRGLDKSDAHNLWSNE